MRSERSGRQDRRSVEVAGMDERSERISQRFEVPMLLAAVLVIPLLIIEESNLGEPWDTIGTVLNWGTWLAFLAELVVMLAAVPDRRQWLREHPVEVVVVVLSPPFLPSSLAAARVLRLLRLVRLLRLAVVVRRLFTMEGVRYVALLAFVTVLAGGTAFAAVEERPKAWDGIWWAATTMTTSAMATSRRARTRVGSSGWWLWSSGLGSARF